MMLHTSASATVSALWETSSDYATHNTQDVKPKPAVAECARAALKIKKKGRFRNCEAASRAHTVSVLHKEAFISLKTYRFLFTSESRLNQVQQLAVK